jgi:hypothetical protein
MWILGISFTQEVASGGLTITFFRGLRHIGPTTCSVRGRMSGHSRFLNLSLMKSANIFVQRQLVHLSIA